MLLDPRGGVTLSRSPMRRSYHNRNRASAAQDDLLPLRYWQQPDRHVLQLPFRIEAMVRSRESVRYAQRQRAQTVMFLMCTMKRAPLSARIRLVRIAPRVLAASDELRHVFEAVRAGVADWLEVAERRHRCYLRRGTERHAHLWSAHRDSAFMSTKMTVGDRVQLWGGPWGSDPVATATVSAPWESPGSDAVSAWWVRRDGSEEDELFPSELITRCLDVCSRN